MKPVIGITIGDPAGIGPEIVMKSLTHEEVINACNPVVIGDIGVLEYTKRALRINVGIKFESIDDINSHSFKQGIIPVIDLDILNGPIEFGNPKAEYGYASFMYIKKATELALKGELDAIATAPINKIAIKLANVNFIGHTEMFGELTNTKDPLTMFVLDEMRVFFLSRHVSLRKAIDMVKYQRILDYILRCVNALKKMYIDTKSQPFAVAGLNPHSGEGGLFGDEEVKEVIPAIEEARRKGINVVGPVSADSVFYLARKGKFSGVLSMYHDQGHIATKTVDLERTISVTLELPFLRTSVDHGTAYDIAGKGIASEIGMKEAIIVAVNLLKKQEKGGN